MLRMGNAGFIIGHSPSDQPEVRFVTEKDFDPPLVSWNFFEIIQRWGADFSEFDFTGRRTYSEKEAQIGALRQLLDSTLDRCAALR